MTENTEAFTRLGLQVPQKKRTVQWLEQVAEFYRVAALYQKELSKFGLTKAQIEQVNAMPAGIQTKRQQSLQHKGNAQHATHGRDQSLQSLRQWCRSFKVITRIAPENEPQLLESLGVVVTAK